MALLEYKCPNCFAALRFNTETQEMTCLHCNSIINVEALKAMDEELSEDQTSEAATWGYEGSAWNHGEQQGMVVYSCKSCSGEIVGDETLGATTCPFCGNQIVVASKFSGTLRPDMIIPFKYDKAFAISALKNYYKGKSLLPKTFNEENHIDEIKGVYVPFWLYDSDINAHIEFMATKKRSWSTWGKDYTETSVYRVVRDGSIGFDSVPVDGSRDVDNNMT